MPKVATLIFDIDSTDTSGTTYDATVTGLGDVTAFFYAFAAQDLDGTQDVSRYEYAGCGGIDSGGTFDCYSISGWDQDSSTVTNNERVSYFLGNETLRFQRACDLTVSRITDGLRLTKSTGTPTANRQFQVSIHAISGIKASVGSIAIPNNSTVGFQTNASDGSGNIDCNTAFFLSQCHSGTNTYGNIVLPSYGFAQRITDSTFRQWSQNWHQPDGPTTSDNTTYFSTAAPLNQVAAGSVHWSAPVTSWTANGSTSSITLTATNYGGQANNDSAAYIAFEDTLKAYVDDRAISYGTSNETLTGNSATGHNAKLFFMGGMSVFAQDTIDTGSTSSTCQWYWRSDKSSSSVVESNSYGYSQDNVGTTVTDSVLTNSSGFNIVEYSGFTNPRLSGTTSFNGQDVDVAYSTAPLSGTGNYGYFLVSDDWTQNTDFPVNSGSFALTGNAADLVTTIKLAADSGSFSVSGQAATLSIDTKLQAGSGSFIVSGTADLRLDIRLSVNSGSFTVTGHAATLFEATALVASSGSFAVAGSATLQAQVNVTFEVNSGSFSLSGSDVFYGVTLGATAGNFQVAGGFAGLIDTGSILKTPYYYRVLLQE
jgi:hypothetical protein